MCFPAAWNHTVKPAGTETSGKRSSQRSVNAMRAGSQRERLESQDCIIMCHETPWHQIHRMPLDFWIMLLRNWVHSQTPKGVSLSAIRIEWPRSGTVDGVEGGYGVSHLDGGLATIPLALPPSMTLLTEGGKGSKPTAPTPHQINHFLPW